MFEVLDLIDTCLLNMNNTTKYIADITIGSYCFLFLLLALRVCILLFAPRLH